MADVRETDLRVAVLGLGEAGRLIAADLVGAGVEVAGYDPYAPGLDAPARNAASVADAVRGVGVVLSLVTAAAAERVLGEGVDHVAPGAVWADLNTAGPAAKLRLAGLAAAHDVLFADVALLAPVPGLGLRTPALAAGEGAARYAEVINGLIGAGGIEAEGAGGGPVTVVDGAAGAAATRKLLRSVFMKGLAAAVLESLAAAGAAQCEPWMRQNLAEQLGADLVRRLEEGSARHAVRRVAEAEAACALLDELGVPARVAGAARDWLADLAVAAREAAR